MIEPGQQFGLYVVKEILEADSMQTVCCAEDPFFNRNIVLNIYPTENFPNKASLSRLEAAFERLAVLEHPSLAPIYDSGLEGDAFYYTSACAPPVNLAQLVVEPLPVDEALKIIFEVTQALDYAYDKGFVQPAVKLEKICFDEQGKTILYDFAIEQTFSQLRGEDDGLTAEAESARIAAGLHNLGELLLQMLLGPEYDPQREIETLCEKVTDGRLKHLVGRFLLPGEWRFASYAELLEELRCFDELEERLTQRPQQETPQTEPAQSPADGDTAHEADPSEELVTDIRQLVADNKRLQQALDQALGERSQLDTRCTEKQRQLARAKQELTKLKEEADVAWELVAGQKYDRWRPVAWTLGGFAIGFILSGSYGYYYSEQTRHELLAKLQANEQLIKSATWRAEPPEQPPQPASQTQASQPTTLQETTLQESATAATPATEQKAVPETVVAAEANSWWPAGSEFSAAAAIPIEQLKAILQLQQRNAQTDLSNDSLQQEVVTTVRRWAESWANQDLSGYFSLYSANYRPELGRSQHEWREMRRSRVTRPQWIELDIDDIRVRKVGENRVQVKLKQSYRSDFYQDQILKSINLIREGGEWRILMERSLGQLPTEDIVGG